MTLLPNPRGTKWTYGRKNGKFLCQREQRLRVCAIELDLAATLTINQEEVKVLRSRKLSSLVLGLTASAGGHCLFLHFVILADLQSYTCTAPVTEQDIEPGGGGECGQSLPFITSGATRKNDTADCNNCWSRLATNVNIKFKSN